MESLPVSSRRIILASLIITLGIFLTLPFSEFLVRQKAGFSLRKIETTHLKKAPPQRPPQMKKEKKELPKPRLDQKPKRLLPLPLAASLGLDLNPGAGDFALQFSLKPAISQEDFVFELSQVDTPPQPVAQVPPLYPVTARMKGIEGEVTLVFIVRTDGSTDNIQVNSSEPKGVFDTAAINAIEKWRFKPATSGGTPVACRVILPLKFEVEE